MEHIEELKIEIFKLFSVCPANTIIKGYIKDYLYTLLYEKKYYLSDYFLKDLYALKLLDIHNNSEILDFCWNIIEYNRY